MHAKADAEERDFPLSSVTDGLNFAFDAAFAKSARYQDSIVPGQQSFGAFLFDFTALNWNDSNLGSMLDACVVERLVNRLVRIPMFGIFPDNRDTDFVLWIAKGEHHVVPRVQVKRLAGQMKTLHHKLIEFVISEGQGNFVDRKVFIQFLDDRFQRDIAKQCNFLSFFARDTLFAATDQHVGLDPYLSQQAHRMLCRLRFYFGCGLEIWHESQVDKQAIVASDVLRKLSNRLEKR